MYARETEIIRQELPPPRMVKVRRRGGWMSVWMEPHHPRHSMTFCRSLKRAIRSEGDRYDLADRLAPFLQEGLSRYPDDPLTVEIEGRFYLLSDQPNPEKAGKMLVRLAIDTE